MERHDICVTGAGGGIGSAIVRQLLREGYSVIGLDLHRGDVPDHPAYTFLETDITNPESIKAAFSQVCTLTDRLTALINTAGIVYMGSLIEEDAEYMQRILDVNIAGMARVVRIFFPLIEAGRGRIINFSSEYGRFCSIPFHGFYTASKHAVECYTDSLRREVGPLGVSVSCIRPGAVDTGMTHGTVPAFEQICRTTIHYARAYQRLLPLMTGATAHPLSPDRIADTVFRAVSGKHPKRYYNIGQDIRMKLLSCLPAPVIDFIFRLFI